MKRAYNFKDITGLKFGRLMTLSYSHNEGKVVYWNVKCDCGNTVKIRGASLRNGGATSCGCRKGLVHGFLSKTGDDYKIREKFYQCWADILQRCTNPNSRNYPHYGGLGIKVCDRWLKFENFRDDLYCSYLEHGKQFGFGRDTSLDRLNVRGNYELSNVKWKTQKEQNRNMRRSAPTLNYNEHLRQSNILRRLVSNALTRSFGERATLSFIRKIGISPNEFKQYIESLFEPGMTWYNRGLGPGFWQIDHDTPVNKFDLSKESDRLKCWHYTNLQPMWHEANMEKRLQWLK